VHCPKCSSELIPGKRFCHVCGARVEQRCGACGALLQVGYRFCSDCGAVVSGTAPIAAEEAGTVAAGTESPLPAATGASLDRLQRHMPEELAQKLRSGGTVATGERKRVTVLFCDLVGSTAIAGQLDPEEYRDLLEQYLELAFREIYRFEGIVNQLAGDGLMALFGAPIAHEEAPGCAVRAALAIREALERFNLEQAKHRGALLRARFGINTGQVVVGTVGNDLKMDYTAIGDTTNLASRLESLAEPGRILISEATYRLVRGSFAVRAVGPFDVKGKSDPLPAYEVEGPLDQAVASAAAAEQRDLTRFVGRTPELLQLDACYGLLRSNVAQVVAISGEAGSGKSRLLYEFKQRLPADEVTFFEARCSSLSTVLPYAPWIDMLRRYFDLEADAASSLVCDRVGTKLRGIDVPLDRTVPLICRLLSASAQGLDGLTLEELKRETFGAIGRLVGGVSKRGLVVLAIEDLQWMDEPSREMLVSAVNALKQVRSMLIVTHRPDHEIAWRSPVAFTHLRLAPVSEEDIVAIVRSVAGGALPAELERRIVARAEGNPFFAEEITRSMLEDGGLLLDGDELRLSRPLAEIGIPDTVHELIGARLDRLPAQAKRVAQVAALLGRQFDQRRLGRLLEGEGIDVRSQLEALERRGIVHRKSVFNRDELRFGESVMQEVAYDGLLVKERRRLHERVAHLIEESPDPSHERAALLAYHYARSENRRGALKAALAAGREAERIPSYPAAVGFFRQAWDLAEPMLAEPQGVDDALRRLALDAAHGLCRLTVLYGSPDDPGDLERAAARGRELAEQLGDVPMLAGLHAYEGMITMSRGDESFQRGLDEVEQGLELARRAGLDPLADGISRGLAWSYMIDGRLALAKQTARRTVERLAPAGDAKPSDTYLSSRAIEALVLRHCDELEAARREALAVHELALGVGNRTLQSTTASTLAEIAYVRADYREAIRWADRAVEVGRVIGNAGATRPSAAVALAARAEIGESVALAPYLELIEKGLGGAGNLPLNVCLIVDALIVTGEWRRAETCLKAAAAHVGGRLRATLYTLARANLLLRLGTARHDEAARAFEQALALARDIGSRSARTGALIGKAEIALARGDSPSAEVHLGEAIAISRELGLNRDQARAERLLAPLAQTTHEALPT
jgi:class 3 adenylate cyclase/tetratricopeptide (TPR) repeat protein